jgi:purine-binding chemotaxis protein CheW
MNAPLPGMAERAKELRLAFDRAFAEPVRPDTTVKEDLLAIRVDRQAFAIRLSEITGLFADKKITPVPGSHAALRGVAGFRGTIVPVYDLQILLGHASTSTPRWLVIAAAAPIALAFEAFVGQLRVARDAILPQPSRPESHSYAREFVRTENFAGPVMHLPSLLDAIKT